MAEEIAEVEGDFQPTDQNNNQRKWELVNGKIKCLFEGCTKVFKSRSGFHTHYSRKHNGQTYQRDTEKSLYCDQCFKHFTTKRGLSVHTRAVHQNRYPYICRICDKGYMSSEGYRCHFLKHGGMKKMCNRCNSTFSTENNLQRHLKSSCPANTESHDKFECSTCNLEFISRSALKDHVKGLHQEEYRYSCSCGKSFKWRSSLAKHKGSSKCK